MNHSKRTIQLVNCLTKEDFIEIFGGVFEHSTWIAERAFGTKPFNSLDDLHAKMVNIVQNARYDEQLQLIGAHPELAGKAAIKSELTHYSQNEQSGAGLNQCSKEEFDQLQSLNKQYLAKFGFPFILAVKGHNRQSIIQNFSQRLDNGIEAEFKTCLEQIYKIAKFRLEVIVE